MKNRSKRGRLEQAPLGVLSKLRPAHDGAAEDDPELRGLDETDDWLADDIDRDEDVKLEPGEGESSPDESAKADIARLFCARSGKS